MKKIFFIGDSIRQGYDNYVRESMEGIAEVFAPGENCRFAEYTLRNIHYWKDALKCGDDVDLVHWNVGHWDTLRIYGDDCLTRAEVFADYIERIQSRLEFLFPKAKFVFATSTPVREEDFIEEFEMRRNSDIVRYNNIAIEVLKKHGVVINDLYGILDGRPDIDELHSDQTHYYTPEATELLGGQVNRVICEVLGIDYSTLIVPDKTKYSRPEVKGDKQLYVKQGDYYVEVKGI
ncbi:MAG: SGNH/GDSL hydrolase family protein [Ruminococcaceae bacterium]|nr:SGNH/GDSL hydrolase family protein [Oscillospiraceae bacterium]